MLAPKARRGLHLSVSPENKGWEVLDLTNNKVVTSGEVIFYETLSLEVWKAKYGLSSGRTQAHSPTDNSTATFPLLTEVDEPTHEDVEEVLPPPPVLAPPHPVADRPASTPVSAAAMRGALRHCLWRRLVASLAADKAPSSSTTIGEQPVKGPTLAKQLVNDEGVDDEGEPSAGEESTDSDVVEVPIKTCELQSSGPELRCSGRTQRPPKWLSYHACLPPASFNTAYNDVEYDLLYDDAEDYVKLPELDPGVHADPEHCWDIVTMTVKEALASWKGEVVRTTMDEEICSLISNGTWELVKRPRGGFTQVYGADYDKTYSPVSSYVTMRIFLIIVAVLGLNLMQLDMKNAFLHSKLNWVLYMYQPDYFDDGTGRKKSRVDEALYFKVGDDGVTCWVLVYVDDLISASAMLKELKELLEAAFELRELSSVVKYLGLEIVRNRPTRKLWLHQQDYADKLRKRFIDEEQTGRILKTPVSVEAYAELTFNEEEAHKREEEDYR
ncbi:unnamed protein product [Closterium sp. NIES-53]